METATNTPCKYSPDHKVWEIEWTEPSATSTYKTRTFRSYQKAVEEFKRLQGIPGLNPHMMSFAR